MREADSLHLGAIESAEVFEFGQQRDGCLGNTIASIVTKVSGQDFELPSIYYAWRGMMIKDEVRTLGRHMRKKPDKTREEREIALHRLDQRVFGMILGAMKSNRVPIYSGIPLAEVLESCDMEYKKGGFEEILEAVNSGHEVAVMYKTPPDEESERWWHMAHIGVSRGGNEIVRLSDGSAAITDSTIRAINESADYLNQRAKTWNFVAIKSRF